MDGEKSQADSSGPESNEVSGRAQEGYQPAEKKGYQQPDEKKGYQPGTSNLDPANPPQGGSGVPIKPTAEKNPSQGK